jgi:hypothetical protein
MKQLITILLCLFTLFAEAQVNPNDTTKYFKSYDYGFSYKRLQAREAFIFPTDTVINKLGAVSLNGVIYLGNGIKWTSIGGGSGTTPTLQQVTTAGNLTTNPITIQRLNLTNADNLLTLNGNNDGNFAITRTGTSNELFKVNDGASGYLKFGGDAGYYVQINTSPDGNVELNAPGTSGTIPLSVNGYTANSYGAITIPTIDTSNKFVNRITRTPGKDSIIYFVGANRFAIKDSVGTNPAPVGYYGAFEDTTTQTATLINTAYAVKLGVTDLSNAVTIANNTRIKIANAGIYNIQFSLQLEKSGGSGNMIADIWLRKNGVNLQGTTGKVVLTGSANASPVVAAWNYVIAVSSNDSLELMWATSNDNVVIKATPATSPHPSIPSAILTVTQQSGIMAGTGISPLDTANMLSNYARTNLVNTKLNISDTASMLSSYSTRINGKLNIADTSALQRKSIAAYSFSANNTSATANATAQYFKDTSGTYTGTITWSSSAPTGATNHTYRWVRIGNMVTLNISLVYGTTSSANTSVIVTLPTDCPTPAKPTGLTAASNYLYPAICNGASTLSTSTVQTYRGGLRSNAANNGFEIIMSFVGTAFIYYQTTITYYTN